MLEILRGCHWGGGGGARKRVEWHRSVKIYCIIISHETVRLSWHDWAKTMVWENHLFWRPAGCLRTFLEAKVSSAARSSVSHSFKDSNFKEGSLIYIMFHSSLYSEDGMCSSVRLLSGNSFSSWLLFAPIKPDRKAPEQMTSKFTLKKHKDRSLSLQTWRKNKLCTICSHSSACNEPAVTSVCRNNRRLHSSSSRYNPWHNSVWSMVIGIFFGEHY